jgi:excisionase family DNA binding protein
MRFCVASRSWVYLMAQSGRLPSLKVGGLLRFDPDAVRAFVRGDAQPKVLPLPFNRAR